ncbi:putative MFS aflatoxin efflux pump [Westerdykella ornata]|uniref:Putative MFS aflatoxin efflux pump n=1 Tax=Westerdykella ornata TaxID=318751 RepID=A0A6A6J7G5_WESOR|nr:putative MFS aflatoxin efflux pump [Westerdykella ornata]KAF2272093.1 putative MFS aflatoxin efflux pump [Westerdykella ornata]
MSRPTTRGATDLAAEDSADLEKQKSSNPSRHDTPKTNQLDGTNSSQQPSTSTTALILISVFLSLLLVGLDRTIVSTAIPRIADEFHSLDDVGWYGSAYLLTCCAFQLLFGKIYAFYSVRITLVTSILLFEIGSALCGAAPSSSSFIAGRAIAGVGAAGIFAGTVVSIVHVVPLAKRPKIQGCMGAVMGVATIVGPLVGGAFTTHVTWRWCFYINLPFGAVAIAVILVFFKVPNRDSSKQPWVEKIKQLDGPGTALLVPGVICLLLALQWGGQTYAWSNGRIIALLTLQGVLLPGFVAAQIWLPKTATVPPRILKYRSVAAGLWATTCIAASQYIFIYYLPIWFQAIKGVPAVDSGIRILPLMLAFVLASILGGAINQKIGYYTPLGIAGVCIMATGSGLLTTLEIDTGKGKWIGYQVVYGLGMGFCFQTSNLATQTVLPKRDVPIGMALMFFGGLIGGAVFVSVGENVLGNQLLERLSGLPGFNRGLVTSGGATSLINLVPADQKEMVLVAYNEALRRVYQIGVIVSCLAVLGIGSLEWKSVLKQSEKNDRAERDSAVKEKVEGDLPDKVQSQSAQQDVKDSRV